MIKRPLLLGLTLCLRIPCAFAESPPAESAIPLPAAPFVSEPAAGTKWQIAIKYPDRKAAETTDSSKQETGADLQRPGVIECHCGSSGTKILVKTAQGPVLSEGFVVGNSLLRWNPGTGSVSILPSDEGNFASPIFVRGYQGTGWISLGTYQGIEKIGKEACYKFVKPALTVSDPSEGFSHPELTAWIQIGNKIPLQFRIGDAVYSFSMIEPADADIVLPPEVLKTIEKVNREHKALSAMRRR